MSLRAELELVQDAPSPGGPKRWTKENLVVATRYWAELYGAPPTAESWSRSTRFHPTSNTVIRTFGTWNAMIEASGFQGRNQGTPMLWTRDDCLDALRRWSETHGAAPKMRDFNRANRFEYPPSCAVSARCGGWSAAIAMAGLAPGPHAAGLLWTRDRIAAALLDHLLNRGRWPTCHEWDRAAHGRPCSSTVKAKFGTWNEARRHAGWIKKRKSRGPGLCVGCGTERDNYTDGCKSCKERRRSRARKAEGAAFPLARAATPSDREKVAT